MVRIAFELHSDFFFSFLQIQEIVQVRSYDIIFQDGVITPRVWKPEEIIVDEHVLAFPDSNACEILGYELEGVTASFPQRGCHNFGTTCWGNSLEIVLGALPMVQDWTRRHAAHCGHAVRRRRKREEGEKEEEEKDEEEEENEEEQ